MTAKIREGFVDISCARKAFGFYVCDFAMISCVKRGGAGEGVIFRRGGNRLYRRGCRLLRWCDELRVAPSRARRLRTAQREASGRKLCDLPAAAAIHAHRRR